MINLLQPLIPEHGSFAKGNLSTHPELWNRLAGYWKPSFGVTGLSLRDVSGFDNHGVLTSMSNSNWVIGENGYELTYNGIDESVSIIGTPDSFDVISVTVTVTLNSVASRMAVLRKGTGTTGGNLSIIFIPAADAQNQSGSDEFIFFVSQDSASSLSAQSGYFGGIVADKTYSVSGRWNKDINTGKPVIFVDGAPGTAAVTGTAVSLDNFQSDLFIGQNTQGGIFLDGQVGRLLLHERRLMNGEITHISADPFALDRLRLMTIGKNIASPVGGRIMGALAGHGGLAGIGGIAGRKGGIAG